MRPVALLLALTACGFRTGAAPDARAVEPDARAVEPDAEDAASPDAALDATAAAFCDPADPHLLACYELDGDVRDGSSHHLDATTANVTFLVGQVGLAMLFGDTSVANVPDSPVLDVPALTMEAWIQPAKLPTGSTRATVLDMNGQYALALRGDGNLQCTLVGGAPLAAAASHAAVGRWTHVACTYDGTASALYVDGVAVANASGGEALHTGGVTGMSLAADNPGNGSRLTGLIDQVRLFDVARSASQICQDAARTSCP